MVRVLYVQLHFSFMFDLFSREEEQGDNCTKEFPYSACLERRTSDFSRAITTAGPTVEIGGGLLPL